MAGPAANPSEQTKIYGTGSPANITAAGIPQSGGAPVTPADVNAYLTQLGGAVNGFSNQVSNAVNYLLSSGAFSVYQVVVGTCNQTFTPPNTSPAGGNGQWMGCASGGVGSVITPQVTGRLLAFMLCTSNLNTVTANDGTTVEATAFWGLGTTGPNFGTTQVRNAPGIFGISGAGTQQGLAQSPTGGTNLQNSQIAWGEFTVQASRFAGIFPTGTVVLNQPVWVDMSCQYITTSSGAAPFITAPNYVVVVEY